MAWENASGFGSKINPVILGQTYLSQINDYYQSGQRSQSWSTGGTFPSDVTINTNYANLPNTGSSLAVYESNEHITWSYKHDGNNYGNQVIINGNTYNDIGITLGSNNEKTCAFGFVINHETRCAKVSAVLSDGGSYNYVYVYYRSQADAQALYSALVGNPYDFNRSGGAGSGYIGNSLLSNKKMVGYNVPTSSAESTKTESVEDAKNKATSGKPKIGNGYARITLLQEIIPNPPDEWKTEVEALKDFEIGGKKFINSDIPAGFDGDGFTDKGNYTYVCVSSSTNWQSSFDFSHIATIRITTNSGGGYDVTYENLDHVYMRFQSHISMYGFGMCQLQTGSIDPYYFWPYNTITWQESYQMATNQTHFDNLTNLFKYLNVHYRNVNLFVDGECWALAAKQ